MSVFNQCSFTCRLHALPDTLALQILIACTPNDPESSVWRAADLCLRAVIAAWGSPSFRSRFSPLFAGHVALSHSGHSSTATASSAPRVRASARQPMGFQRWLILGVEEKADLIFFGGEKTDLISVHSDSTEVWLVARPSRLVCHSASGSGTRGFLL